MKRIRPDRWIASLQPPRNPRIGFCRYHHSLRIATSRTTSQTQSHHGSISRRSDGRLIGRRYTSSEAVAELGGEETPIPPVTPPPELNAPHYRSAKQSAKLAALHARLSLPAKFPKEVLARCLIDPSVDPRPGTNNAPFALLGQDLLAFYTCEYLMCRYPRLPLPIIFAAQYAYIGPVTLSAMRAEWGVEVAAAPGVEVDPGLLQLVRRTPGNSMAEDENIRVKDKLQPQRLSSGLRNDKSNYRRGMSSRIVFDDEFGDLQEAAKFTDRTLKTSDDATSSAEQESSPEIGVTVEDGSAGFVRALFGALHTFSGTAATKAYHKDHILSRHLQLHSLFHFTHPTEQLSRLCAREDFEPPVARLISESGRLSRTPVFVVGVYSGDDKLGEAAGASLNEARVRAAAAALRAWYLYSPLDNAVVYPSDVRSDSNKKVAWKPQLIDVGEVFA